MENDTTTMMKSGRWDRQRGGGGQEEVEEDGEGPSMTMLNDWGYSWDFSVGSPAARFSTSWPISNQNSIIYFPHPFSYLVSKIHNHFQKLCDQFRTPTKRFLKIQLIFAYYSFFRIHLELLYLYIWFQTRMGKGYTSFQTKTAQNIPFGAAQTYIAYIR